MSEEFEGSFKSTVEPPEVNLTAAGLPKDELSWLVVAKNRRVNRDWEDLVSRYPENALRCYKHLCESPTQRRQGRVFPLKGKRYKGAWEYELTGSERVFYIPYESDLKVVVYYAGRHPKSAPVP
jgi:hypothetical protein